MAVHASNIRPGGEEMVRERKTCLPPALPKAANSRFCETLSQGNKELNDRERDLHTHSPAPTVKQEFWASVCVGVF